MKSDSGMKDFFGNSVSIGDAVYFIGMGCSLINIGIIHHVCNNMIKIHDGHSEYSVSNMKNIISVNNSVPENDLEEMRKNVDSIYEEKEKKKLIKTRYVWFIYKNRNTDAKGIGWWIISDIDKNFESVFMKKLCEETALGNICYFARNMKEGLFFDAVPSSSFSSSFLFTTLMSTKTYVNYLSEEDVNETRYFELIDNKDSYGRLIVEEIKEQRKKNAVSFNKSRTHFFLESEKAAEEKEIKKYSSIDENFILELKPPKEGEISKYIDFSRKSMGAKIGDNVYYVRAKKSECLDDDDIMDNFDSFHYYILNQINLKKFCDSPEKVEKFFEKIIDKMNMI